MDTKTNHCEDLRDDLAPLVDDDADALARHADHLASCDSCRDGRHAARGAADLVASAGADYRSPADLETRLLAALDARTAAPAAPSTTPAVERRATVLPPITAPAVTPIARSHRRRPAPWAVAAVGLAAAASIAIIVTRPTPPVPQVVVSVPWSGGGKLVRVLRAGSDGASGITVTRPDGSTAPAGEGAAIVPGSTVRTDQRTRVRLEMAEGTALVLDHESEILVAATAGRRIELRHGRLFTDVAHLERGPQARFDLPTGAIEVLGTRFLLTATPDTATVRVVRGRVRASASDGASVEAGAGQEAVLAAGIAPRVSAATRLGEDMAWSELGAVDVGEPTERGLGELRARKPGEDRSRERPLALARQRVAVRIQGNVARTEVEEVFRNDSSDVLEGLFRFPLPPDAQIERLALDVNGHMEEGAFVERDRAAAIWRGVIRNATPVEKRRQEEYVWVPGPWRDPALLEWQSGGRFELKIFPVPAHGQRRVVLAYTQVVPPVGRDRRYVYPFPHAADGSTRVGRLDVEIRVAGADAAVPAAAGGYALAGRRDGAATVLTLGQDAFVPAGDLSVDYRLPDADAELRGWAHAGERGEPGFAAVLLRPTLPGWSETRLLDHVIVVDSSQSMFGERFARASRVAVAMVAEMDRRDRFVIAACDVRCQPMSSQPHAPSLDEAEAVRRFLAGIRPAGASNVAAAIRFGAAAVTPDGGRQVDVVYVGDGQATTGPRRASTLAAEAEAAAQRGGVSVSAIAIGADADMTALRSVTRGGGGHLIAYAPGQRASTAAIDMLEASAGASLRDVEIELPAGMTDVAPARPSTLRAGDELLLTARLGGPTRGDIVVRGRLAGQPWTQRYPISLEPARGPGNAFVSRLWASQRIEDLDASGVGEDGKKAVDLSKRFAVLSRGTSLLVLESAAMFRAFGVERPRPAPTWTGDGAIETTSSSASAEPAADEAAAPSRGGNKSVARSARKGINDDPLLGLDLDAPAASAGSKRHRSASSAAAKPAAIAQPMPSTRTSDPLDDLLNSATVGKRARPAVNDEDAFDDQPRRVARTVRVPARAEIGAVQGDFAPESWERRGKWMRRVQARSASVDRQDGPRPGDERAVAAAETALTAAPDSRDRHRTLFLALARAGAVERSREIAEAWIARDRLDPEALAALADTVARQGERDEAMRLLSGVVDLAPDDRALRERLVAAYDGLGQAEPTCDHRIALAEGSPDSGLTGAALRCVRATGREALAPLLLRGLADESARMRAEATAGTPETKRRATGELVLDASWNAASDVDFAVLDPHGGRLSWMGGRGVRTEGTASSGGERLSVDHLRPGQYLIEVTRASAGGDVTGQLTIEAFGTRRALPFRLVGDHALVGRVTVDQFERLEEVETPLDAPRRLRRSEVTNALESATARARDCARDVSTSTRIDVELNIGAGGRVESSEALGWQAGNSTGRCVARALAATTFPASIGGRIQVGVALQPAGQASALESLTRVDIVTGLNAIKPKISECYAQYRVPGIANAEIMIGRSGLVTSVVVRGKFEGTPTGACVEMAVRSATFPPSVGLPVSYPFVLK